jgi:hypothetical protein
MRPITLFAATSNCGPEFDRFHVPHDYLVCGGGIVTTTATTNILTATISINKSDVHITHGPAENGAHQFPSVRPGRHITTNQPLSSQTIPEGCWGTGGWMKENVLLYFQSA